MTTLTGPTLLFAIHEDGSLEVTSPWFPFIAVSEDLLGRVDGRRLWLSPTRDLLEFRCTNGRARYRLSGSDQAGMYAGRLEETWR